MTPEDIDPVLDGDVQRWSLDPTVLMKRFTVYRRGDLSATHTPNLVNPSDEPQFEGVVFTDGTCVIRWRTAERSTSVFEGGFGQMMRVHGHDAHDERYKTVVVWHDE